MIVLLTSATHHTSFFPLIQLGHKKYCSVTTQISRQLSISIAAPQVQAIISTQLDNLIMTFFLLKRDCFNGLLTLNLNSFTSTYWTECCHLFWYVSKVICHCLIVKIQMFENYMKKNDLHDNIISWGVIIICMNFMTTCRKLCHLSTAMRKKNIWELLVFRIKVKFPNLTFHSAS